MLIRFDEHLTEADLACLQKLKAKGITRRYPKKTVLCQQNDLGKTAYAVIKGVAKVVLVSRTGETRVMTYLTPGSLFGQGAAFLGFPGPSALMVISATDVEVLVVQRKTLLAEMTGSEEMCAYMLKCAALQICSLMNHIEIDSFGDTLVQVAAVLHSLPVEEYGSHKLARISQEEIASIIGKTRVSVARALGSLRSMDIINLGSKKNIVIKNSAELARVAGENDIPRTATWR